MFYVRINEGGLEGVTLYDLHMAAPPRVGETITLMMPDRSEPRFEVVGVDYAVRVQLEDFSVNQDTHIVNVSVRRR